MQSDISADIYLEDCVVPDSAHLSYNSASMQALPDILAASRVFVGI